MTWSKQGAEGIHVEPDSEKANAAYPADALLLLRAEGNRGERTVYLYRCTLG